jgi:SAM-dependent methyltransferase
MYLPLSYFTNTLLQQVPRSTMKHISDKEFNALFPREISQHSKLYWSSKEAIEIAVTWLKPCKNILDIGSGNGKFCLIGSHLISSKFTGVELRENLVILAKEVALNTNSNAVFINDDIKNIDFSGYDAFFFYNSFAEHISIENRFTPIDDKMTNSDVKYEFYQTILNQKLKTTKIGSLFVTHNNEGLFMPDSFELQEMTNDNELGLWKKIK